MNNSEIRFRESFRGYNRDDVIAYIEQLNIIFSRREADLHAYISDLEAKLNSIPQQPVNTHTDNEWDELFAKYEDAQNEIKRIISENKVAKEAEKAKIYDEMSTQVGNIIISANTNADKIISDAKEEAERIKSKANAFANGIRDEAFKMRDEIVGTVNNKVRDFAVECVTQYGAIIGETNVKLENLADNLKNRSAHLLASLESKTGEIEAKLTLHNEE